MNDESKLWLEVKVGWKHYLRSDGTFHNNTGTFRSYLARKGKNRSHSLA